MSSPSPEKRIKVLQQRLDRRLAELLEQGWPDHHDSLMSDSEYCETTMWLNFERMMENAE